MGRKLYYFRKESGLEIDFVTRYIGKQATEVLASSHFPLDPQVWQSIAKYVILKNLRSLGKIVIAQIYDC